MTPKKAQNACQDMIQAIIDMEASLPEDIQAGVDIIVDENGDPIFLFIDAIAYEEPDTLIFYGICSCDKEWEIPQSASEIKKSDVKTQKRTHPEKPRRKMEPSAKSKTPTKVASNTKAKIVTKTTAKAAPKADAKTTTKTTPKTDAKTTAKAAPKTVTKTAAKPAPKTCAKDVAKSTPKAKAKTTKTK